MWRILGVALVLVISILAAAPAAAQGETRVALLVGNATYESEIGRLANPHNDECLRAADTILRPNRDWVILLFRPWCFGWDHKLPHPR